MPRRLTKTGNSGCLRQQTTRISGCHSAAYLPRCEKSLYSFSVLLTGCSSVRSGAFLLLCILAGMKIARRGSPSGPADCLSIFRHTFQYAHYNRLEVSPQFQFGTGFVPIQYQFSPTRCRRLISENPGCRIGTAAPGWQSQTSRGRTDIPPPSGAGTEWSWSVPCCPAAHPPYKGT